MSAFRLRPALPAVVLRRAAEVAGTSGRLACLLAALLSCMVAAPAALAADAALTVNLEAGKHKAVRLRNLPKDAVMAVVVQSSGKIAISLLSEGDYRTFPRVAEPVFAGSVERSLSFQIVIPAAGSYYLVLDNRQAAEERKVKLGIRAQRGRSQPPATQPPPEPGSGERKQGT